MPSIAIGKKGEFSEPIPPPANGRQSNLKEFSGHSPLPPAIGPLKPPVVQHFPAALRSPVDRLSSQGLSARASLWPRPAVGQQYVRASELIRQRVRPLNVGLSGELAPGDLVRFSAGRPVRSQDLTRRGEETCQRNLLPLPTTEKGKLPPCPASLFLFSNGAAMAASKRYGAASAACPPAGATTTSLGLVPTPESSNFARAARSIRAT
jgi:hypothetical protein